jgi:hypothetical protein
VNDISGYTWNPVYSALTNGSYTLLPYLIVKASAVWTRYNFNPNNQQFGSLASLAVTGNTTVGGTLGVTGAISGATVNTGQGANELYAMNQNVRTTDIPTFLGIITTNGPNKPVDNNDASMPSVGIGGFTFGINSKYEAPVSVSLPSGGAYIYAVKKYTSAGNVTIDIGRAGGGTTFNAGGPVTDSTSYIQILAWRIA